MDLSKVPSNNVATTQNVSDIVSRSPTRNLPINTGTSRNVNTSYFDCRNAKSRVHLGIGISVLLLTLWDFAMVCLSVWSIVEGSFVQTVTEEQSLLLGGVLQMVSGISVLIVVVVMSRRLLKRTGRPVATSNSIKLFCIGLLYLLIMDIAAVIVIGNVHKSNFRSLIYEGMLNVLMEGYGLDSKEKITSDWNKLQSDLSCCGALDYTEWFDTTWSLAVKVGHNHENTSGIFPASCLANPLRYIEEDCNIVRGFVTAKEPLYTALRNLTMVRKRDQILLEPEYSYINQAACAPVLHTQLQTDMGITFIISIIGILFEVSLIAVLFKLASRLPHQQRVCSVYIVEDHSTQRTVEHRSAHLTSVRF